MPAIVARFVASGKPRGVVALDARLRYTQPVSLQFIRPCAPTSAKSIPRGDAWLHGPKLDGYRLQIVKSGPPLSLPEMICKEGAHPAARIFGGLRIVFRPVAEHHSPRLKKLNVERMVSPWIGDELNRYSGATPVLHRSHAILCRCPVVELANENECRHAWTGADDAAPWIEGNGRTKRETVRVDEELA